MHFRHQDDAPVFRAGGALEIVRHEVELLVPADQIPEELVVDLMDVAIGDTIRMSAITLPEGATPKAWSSSRTAAPAKSRS